MPGVSKGTPFGAQIDQEDLSFDTADQGELDAHAGQQFSDAHPGWLSGTEANRPDPGTVDRYYVATDTQKVYRDDGGQWVDIAWAASVIGSGDLGFDPATQAELNGHAGDDQNPHGVSYTQLGNIPLAQFANILNGDNDVELAHLGTLDSDGDGSVDQADNAATADNADKLDGNHASAFAAAGHGHAHSDLTGVGTDDHHAAPFQTEYIGDGTTRTINIPFNASWVILVQYGTSSGNETMWHVWRTDFAINIDGNPGTQGRIHLDANGDLVVGDGGSNGNRTDDTYGVLAFP